MRNRGNTVELDETDAPAETEAADTSADDVTDGGQPDTSESETVSLDAFWAAVDSFSLPTDGEPDFSALNTAYNTLSRKGKMQAGHAVQARINKALDDDEFATAKKLSKVKAGIKSDGSANAATGVDPSDELVTRIAGIQLALENLLSTNSALSERIASAVSAARTDENHVANSVSRKLVETKMGRKPREGGGTRHNVGKHIAQVFADKESGAFLDFKAIAAAKSEEYGDDLPNPVSISTHLKGGKFEQDGLEVREVDKKLGVYKN